jgi:tetratricopeptide (TPR) repeat protein
MFLLRLRQASDGNNRYRVTVELDRNGARRSAEPRFDFQLSAQDQEDIRWYLEDFLQYPIDPAPAIAARIERRMTEIGVDLFTKVLGTTPVWHEVRHDLSETRIEIETTVKDATAVPWELLRDPEADVPLALRARAFVRALHDAVQRPKPPRRPTGPIRVLLAICRPRGRADVPFRSVAKRLLEILRESEGVRLSVLRPPTFEQLSRVLREAKAEDKPYHLVHFDGHGVWIEDGPREGGHGYVLFENPVLEENQQLVDGPMLGNLLAETGVPVLVLNACQSAYANPPAQPVVAPDSPHAETRAFGSLAQELMDAGAAGVVAMRYSVLVETAARFMADLYGRLARGDALGEAVSFGRKQLRDQPLRGIGFDPRPLQDWLVPVVFEAEPVALFARPAAAAPALSIRLDAKGAAEVAGLPPRPDAGFFGRDETLLALDRAFDRHRIVLLHAYAGSGKTSAAAEFARWYRETAGIEGPVLFTTFERYKPLAGALDSLGQVFGQALEKAGIHWLALDNAERRAVALQVLGQIPVLWIWDNVEPVAGFPKGSESKWSTAEQRELADFLRAACETKAKFLLTSRRDERDWLVDLPARVPVPPMPFQEQVELARALAEKQGRRLTDVEDWRPLLEFTQGNPLVITVLVGQALRDGWRTRAQVEAFVARLRAGEAVFEDEAGEGRTRSLAASLDYGFKHAFSETERKQLALLHLFQGFVDVDAFRRMTKTEREPGIWLLDRAAEVGLLTAHGGGYYSIHPALPWFFRKLFEEHYADARDSAVRSYVTAIVSLGNYYAGEYERGERKVIGALKAEEANLLHAHTLARSHAWWTDVTGSMRGLHQLYEHTGRGAEWARLVEEIVPDFVDPTTNGSLPGMEEQWGEVTLYRVRLAREARQWRKAELLQDLGTKWYRRRAAEDLDRGRLRSLALSLKELGQIQCEQGRPECREAFDESFRLALRIDDSSLAGAVALYLGNAYKNLAALLDLDESERWYRKSLDLHPEPDRQSRAVSLGQLGHLSVKRFEEARGTQRSETECRQLLEGAQGLYLGALEMTPPDAVHLLAGLHNALGGVCGLLGDPDSAMYHLLKSIRYAQSAGDLYSAAQTQYNVALALMRAGRLPDAREYALAALRNYQPYGASAAADVQKTLDLVADIAKAASG